MLYMVFALISGLILGLLFFGGLWLTVKKSVTSKSPALWISGSFIFRISITLIGFYYISLGNWQNLLICLVGFVAARYLVINLTKSNNKKQLHVKKEAFHEA